MIGERGRRRWGCTLLLMAAIVSGCAGSSDGKALVGIGPQSDLTFYIVQPIRGHLYRFAFPRLRNATSKPVTVTGFNAASVAPGVKVLGYPVYSVNDVGGRYLVDFDEAHAPHLPQMTNYAGRRLVIPPKRESPYVAMIRVQLTSSPVDDPVPTIHGCVVHYEVDGHPTTQTFECNFAVGRA